MARRNTRGELEFGSDSFLDIVANIVGILIILIVVAGVRVGSMPVAREALSTETPQTEPVASSPQPVPQELVLQPVPPAPPLPPREPVAAPRPTRPPQPSPDLVAQRDRLEDRITTLQEETAQGTVSLAESKKQLATLRQRLADLEQKFQTSRQSQAAAATTASRMQAELNRMQGRLRQLTVDLESASATATPVELKHRLTPVSTELGGKELHFRLSGGKVAHVPLQALLERLRTQVQGQRARLTRPGRHLGQVGPQDGFVMDFVVERQELSALERLQTGGNYIRVGISRWEIKPSPSLQSETIQQALGDRSRFLQVLYSAEPETALTFWVYPDSFEEFRQLQEFSHREGFRVAARPLPFGIAIAGSPSGTRSAGQ